MITRGPGARGSFAFAVLALGAPAAGPAARGQDPGPPQEVDSRVWPIPDWPVSTPRAEGMDPAGLEALHRDLGAGRHGFVDSMLVVRRGRIVAEHHYEHDYAAASAGRDLSPHQYNYDHPDWHPFYQGREVHTLQSVTKSIASTLIGIAIRRGEIPGTEVPALSFFGDRSFPDPDGRKAKVTLEDLLTMRAGLKWDEWSSGYDSMENDCIQLEAAEDWVDFVLHKPMATDPGTTFVYNSGASHLLSGILAAATGETMDAYAEKHLFGPLGIRDYHWKKSPRGLPDTEGGLYLKPRDLARFGLLFLRQGEWNGETVVSREWVESATTPWVEDIAPSNPRSDRGYGYQWWVLEPGSDERPKVYAALGFGGQFLFVCPGRDLLAVFTGWNIHTRTPPFDRIFRDELVPATR